MSILSEVLNKTIPLGVYHIHNWEGGFSGAHSHSGEMNEYITDMKMMVDFFISVFDYKQITSITVTSLFSPFECWSDLKENHIYINVIQEAIDRGIDLYNYFHLDIKNDFKFLNLLIESNFCYLSNFLFCIDDLSIIIDPTHNFEYLCYCMDQNDKDYIVRYATNHCSYLRYYY